MTLPTWLLRPASAPDEERPFRADIQGLRALAVLLVVAYHAGLPGIPGGYVGVDVFFVVSGFLITGLLLGERARRGSVSLLGFYARRARRILPAATLVLVAVVVAASQLLIASRAATVGADARAAAVFLANWHFAAVGSDYLSSAGPPSPLRHFWSLAVEEQFYLVWPALFLALAGGRRLLRRRQLAVGLAALTVASLAWSSIETMTSGQLAYFSPFTRAWELTAGALLAVIAPQVRRLQAGPAAALGWAGLAGIGVASVLYDASTRFPGVAAALPVAGTVLVLACGTTVAPQGPERLLRAAPLQLLGLLSYSLYLWHWPVLVLGAAYAGRDLTGRESLLLVLLALVLSVVTYLLVENPVRRLPRLSGSRSGSLALGAALTAVALLAGSAGLVHPRASLVAAAASEATPAQVRAAVSAAGSIRVLPAGLTPDVNVATLDEGPAYSDGCLLDPEVTQLTTKPCVYGDPRGTKTMVLLGDSHAGQWLPAFIEIGKQAHWRVVLVAKVGCPSADLRVWSPELDRAYRECSVWRQAALQHVAALHPDLVVHTANGNTTRPVRGESSRQNLSPLWRDGLVRTLIRLRPSVGRQVVLGDIPTTADDPVQCLASNPTDAAACATPRARAVDSPQQQAERTAAARTGTPYIDVTPLLCTPVTCPTVIDTFVVYRDRFHLTAAYSRWLAPSIAASLHLS
ncbi:MAG: acyltransferase [Actinobacteria bacterium]|nr:acyltransferase [Actinomycetota bacterium]